MRAGRGHIDHDACRRDGIRKTIPRAARAQRAPPSATCPTADLTRPCRYGAPGPRRHQPTSCGAPTWPDATKNTSKFATGTLGLAAARVRVPRQADRCIRLVIAVLAQLPLVRPLSPGRARREFANIRPRLGTPAHAAKPTRPGPRSPNGSRPGPRDPVRKKTGNLGKTDVARNSKIKT